MKAPSEKELTEAICEAARGGDPVFVYEAVTRWMAWYPPAGTTEAEVARFQRQNVEALLEIVEVECDRA